MLIKKSYLIKIVLKTVKICNDNVISIITFYLILIEFVCIRVIVGDNLILT